MCATSEHYKGIGLSIKLNSTNKISRLKFVKGPNNNSQMQLSTISCVNFSDLTFSWPIFSSISFKGMERACPYPSPNWLVYIRIANALAWLLTISYDIVDLSAIWQFIISLIPENGTTSISYL